MSAHARAELAGILEAIRTRPKNNLGDIVASQTAVQSRFRPYFSPEHLPYLTQEEVWEFLSAKNNRHWTGLERHRARLTANMPVLRKTFSILLDEGRPISERLRAVRPKNGDNPVPSLGRAILTAVLVLMHSAKYGVLNTTVETAMKELGIWPAFPRGADFAEKYLKVNGVLLGLASDLGIDLWTLDALWWGVLNRSEVPPGVTDTEDEDKQQLATDGPDQSFGMERHLHDFLVDNWEHTELGKEWALLEEDGELVGSEYDTGSVGRIDLLAKHRSAPRWLVIELKRGQSSDQTVGQVLRYCGWVEEHLAEEGEAVEGLVISRSQDTGIRYALKRVAGVRAMTYQVSFTLANSPG